MNRRGLSLAALSIAVIFAYPDLATGQSFFAEDFSKVERGKLPKGWRGETMLVRDGALVLFKASATHTLHGPKVEFPDDFRFDLTIRTIQVGKYSFGGATYELDIGNASLKLTTTATGVVGSRSSIAINDTKTELSKAKVDNTTVKLALEKRDNVFRVFVNGTEAAVARIEKFAHDNTFTFQVRFNGLERNYEQFKLLKVEGTKVSTSLTTNRDR